MNDTVLSSAPRMLTRRAGLRRSGLPLAKIPEAAAARPALVEGRWPVTAWGRST